jgi:hypothetical protein
MSRPLYLSLVLIVKQRPEISMSKRKGQSRLRTDSSLLRLSVEGLAHALQHIVRNCNRETELERVSMEAVLPLRLLVGIETSDQNVVVPSVDRPFRDVLPRLLLFEVWLRP